MLAIHTVVDEEHFNACFMELILIDPASNRLP